MPIEGLDEPFALISVPRPLGGSVGKSHASSALEALTSRTRAEVAVAVDGEGIYLYKVDTPRLIASHPVSPQTQFLCPPVSLHLRRSDKSIQRATYVVVQSRDSSDARLLSLVEEEGRLENTETSGIAKSEIILDAGVADISSLVPIVVDPDQQDITKALHFLVIHRNGLIQRFLGDLKSSLSKTAARKPASPNESDIVEFAAVRKYQDLESTLLSRRADLRASFSITGTDVRAANVLVLIRWVKSGERSPTTRRVYVAAISASGSTSIILQRLATLRTNDTGNAEASQIELSSDGSLLSACIQGNLHTWTLTGMDASAYTSFDGRLQSFVHLDGAELLAVEEDRCLVADLQWQTLKAELRLLKRDTATALGSMRSRDTIVGSFDHMQLVSYHAKASLAVALGPGVLIGFSIRQSEKLQKRRRFAPSSLADNVGKAAITELQSDSSKLSDADKAFETEVQSLVAKSDVQQLEEFVAKDLDISFETLGSDEARSSNGVKNSSSKVESSSIVRWTFPSDDFVLSRKTNMTHARLVYNILFQSTGESMSVAIFAPNIFRWLSIIGLLKGHSSHNLREGDGLFVQILEATAKLDPSLSCVHEVMQWPQSLDCRIVSKALQLAIDSLDIAAYTTQLQIEDAVPNGIEHDMDTASIADASKAAEDDLAFALASLDDGASVRSGLLRCIFERLSVFPSAHLATALRKQLSPRHVVFLINLLRIELADGGWTTRYTDELYEREEDDIAEGPADQSLKIISHLLDAAIDAIGLTGWSVGLSSDKQLKTDDMLSILRAEINAVLEGSLEYQSIDASLQDFCKFCTQFEPTMKKTRSRRKTDPLRNPGFVRDETEDALLPMGSRVDNISKTRTSKGGRVNEKSKSAIGQELSMRVGTYSFDRIRA